MFTVSIVDLFGLRRIGRWILNRMFKKVEKKLDEIDEPRRRRKVLVIDDDCGMKTYLEKWADDMDIEQIYRIPADLSILAGYDALVVDGLGIGNGKYREGVDLLLDYDKPEGQSVVYHSGLGSYGRERETLERRGVAVVTKGSNPEKLVLAIRFSKMKAVETAKEEKAEKAEKIEKSKKAKCCKYANRRHKRRR